MTTSKKRPLWKRTICWGLLSVALILLAAFVWYRWTFPYGRSHCCILNVGGGLISYAEDHEGRFPSGGDCPEASLGLLYSNYANAYLLRGKTVPLSTAEEALANNGKLGPESCAWHYVEGLTQADDPEIAILWDKIGLGHNGQRLSHGGHEVYFIGGDRRFITAKQWPEFLNRQEVMLAQRSEDVKHGIPALRAKIRFPNGTEVNEFDGEYFLSHESSSGSGTSSSTRLDLLWMRIYEPDGPCIWRLELPSKRMRSKPVTFEVKAGRAIPDFVVFEMEAY